MAAGEKRLDEFWDPSNQRAQWRQMHLDSFAKVSRSFSLYSEYTRKTENMRARILASKCNQLNPRGTLTLGIDLAMAHKRNITLTVCVSLISTLSF